MTSLTKVNQTESKHAEPVFINGIRISTLPETQLASRPKKPAFKLLLDDLELMQTFDSPSAALRMGSILIENEVDMMIDDLEKELRRVNVYVEENTPDLSLSAMKKREVNITQLLSKLKKIGVPA